VPLPYISIQQAIDAAAPGDTIQIAPGTYTENINLKGKNITIRAFNTNFETVIDGGQAGPVVTFKGNEPATCMIRNLTLRNGKAANGAGVLGNSTFATLRNCVIGGNTATGNGGGIHGFSGLIQKCTITQNQAANGGGISDSDGLIDSCVITINRATAMGGGIANSPGIIQFNEITRNEAAIAGGGINASNGYIIGNLLDENIVTAAGPAASPASFGGGINDAGGTVTLNRITNNVSGGDGGGMANSPGVIQNNIIAGNGARRGGGLATCTGRIENNTVWGNVAAFQGGGSLNLGPLVANSIFYNNSAPTDSQWAGANVPTYSCVQGWTGGQIDILTADPQLEAPGNGRFDLLPSSPCIDAGRFVPGLTTDYEGDPRPFNGTDALRGDGSDIDIGADEFMPANLDVAATWASVNSKTKGKPGKLKTSIQGQLFVASTGSEQVTTPFFAQFFLSNDPVWDPSDQAVGKLVAVKKLKPGKSKKAKCKIKLPVNQTVTGQYLIGVADSGNHVPESNEANNIAVWGPLP
jgi:hypothetical protein